MTRGAGHDSEKWTEAERNRGNVHRPDASVALKPLVDAVDTGLLGLERHRVGAEDEPSL